MSVTWYRYGACDIFLLLYIWDSFITTWQIKTSTNTLPTLDILNRNFPKITLDCAKWLLCDNETETNNHFGNVQCSTQLLKTRSFTSLAWILQATLQREADKLSICVPDTIKHSKTFKWAFEQQPIKMEAILLMRLYVTHDLFSIFTAHFNTHKSISSILLPSLNQIAENSIRQMEGTGKRRIISQNNISKTTGLNRSNSSLPLLTFYIVD